MLRIFSLHFVRGTKRKEDFLCFTQSFKFFSPEGAPCGSGSVGALDALGSGSDLAAVRVFVGASLG